MQPAATYDSKERFLSYWDQIAASRALKPASILEVGVGTRFYSRYMADHGYSVTTVDIDRTRAPQVCGSLTALPLGAAGWDLVVCCQLLEHLPFDTVPRALGELRRVTRRHLLVSVPNCAPTLGLTFRIARKLERVWTVPIPRPAKPSVFDGQHHWELGQRGYTVQRLVSTFDRACLAVERAWRVGQFPYHHFFVLAKT